MTYPIMGCEYTWWRGDPLPALPPLAGFRAGPSGDVTLLVGLHGLDCQAIESRIEQGSQPYVAFIAGTPAAYGWSATRAAGIVDARLCWPLSPEDRHLWDFATLPAWRGQGLYPRLLQAILRREAAEAARFWIGHEAANSASRQGILKAGFQLCAVAVFAPRGQLKAVALGRRDRAPLSPLGQHLGFIEVEDDEMTL